MYTQSLMSHVLQLRSLDVAEHKNKKNVAGTQYYNI